MPFKFKFNDGNEEMWRISFALSFVALLAGVFSLMVFSFQAPALVGPNIFLSVVSGAGALVLLLTKKRNSATIPDFVLLTVVAVVLLTIWLNHDYYVHSGGVFHLFSGVKLLALLIGLFAPPKHWVGWLCLASAGTMTLVRYFSWPLELRHGLSIQEPWMTLLAIFSGDSCISFGSEGGRWNRKPLSYKPDSFLLQRFAHLLINAQHLANTPLQTMCNTVKLLKTTHPEIEKELEPIERSLARVKGIVQLFSGFDSYVSWKDIDVPDTMEGFQKQAKELFEMANSLKSQTEV